METWNAMKRYWNKFLNWLIPNRREKILIKMMRESEELGLYDEPSTPREKINKSFSTAEELAEWFHDNYEEVSLKQGWKHKPIAKCLLLIYLKAIREQ